MSVAPLSISLSGSNKLRLYFTVDKMGLNQSRQLEKQLNEACSKADHVGSTQVSRFLGDTVSLPDRTAIQLTMTVRNFRRSSRE